MAHRSDPRLKIHLALMCLLVLGLASPASAESPLQLQGGTNDGGPLLAEWFVTHPAIVWRDHARWWRRVSDRSVRQAEGVKVEVG